jgi:cell division protein FtsB
MIPVFYSPRGMESLWDSIKGTARQVGTAAGVASQKAKLKTEIMFIERNISSRQQQFGVQLYDYVSVWSARPEFFAANSDNILIWTLRAPLIEAQREIAALHLKRTSLKERINQTDVARSAAFHRRAENWQEKLHNAGKSTAFAGSEARLKTELALVEREITKHKHQFGVAVYRQFVLLEDTKQWLPTDREVRSFYDSCRKDVEAMKSKIAAKQQEIATLDNGGYVAEGAATNQTNNNNNNSLTMNTGIIDPPKQQTSEPFNAPPPIPNNNLNDYSNYNYNQQNQDFLVNSTNAHLFDSDPDFLAVNLQQATLPPGNPMHNNNNNMAEV